jgi:hypothetical protein
LGNFIENDHNSHFFKNNNMMYKINVIKCEKRGDTVTAFNSIGVKAARKLKATTLGWEDAMRVLRRSHKLLRQLRQLSAGPASRRPRLLHLPREALELMAAYGVNDLSSAYLHLSVLKISPF